MAIERDLSSLILNKVPDNKTFSKMKEQGLLNEDELYLIEEQFNPNNPNLDIDKVPTEGSENLVTSGGVYQAVKDINAIPYTEKEMPNGVATLGKDGKVPAGQLPETKVDAFTKAETLTGETAKLYGLGEDAIPDSVLKKAKELIDQNRPQIQTVEWTGTGEDVNRIHFQFPPDIVFLAYIEPLYDTYSYGIVPEEGTGGAWRYNGAIVTRGQSILKVHTGSIKVEFENNDLILSPSYLVSHPFNDSGKRCMAIAIKGV